MQEAHILIVEDEDVTRFTLRNLFEAEGYLVSEATDSVSMEQRLEKHNFDLVLMDINLPGKNGLMLARQLKTKSDLGLIFLTSRDSDIDKVLGLEIGADDYLTKPFNPQELTIRARNILNRISINKNPDPSGLVRFNRWQLDPNSRTLTSPDGDSIAIPRGEYRALQLLIKHKGQIVTRQQLIKTMTGRDLRVNDRSVDVTIRRLRQHFEASKQTVALINTVHGEGYRFVGTIE
jgi:two-component system aerobic respiration control protein ArcA